MEIFDEMLKELNNEKILIESDVEEFFEDIDPLIYEKYFKGVDVKNICTLDTDHHRWYTLATSVIFIYGRYLGVRGICNVKSDSMSYDDCGCYYKFFEMKQVESVTYIEI